MMTHILFKAIETYRYIPKPLLQIELNSETSQDKTTGKSLKIYITLNNSDFHFQNISAVIYIG